MNRQDGINRKIQEEFDRLNNRITSLTVRVDRLSRYVNFASHVAEVLSEYGNGTSDEEVEKLRDMAFELALDWST